MNNLLITTKTTIKEAFKKLNKSGQKCLIVSDSENILLGTLTDGDLRNAILKGIKLDSTIKNYYQQNPTSVLKGHFNRKKIKQIFIKNLFDLIPVVDHDNKIIDVIFWKDIFKDKKNTKTSDLDVPVVIMAGGKGSRLEPFTKILPKTLVPVNEKTIIEHIIDSFTNVGCNDFILSVNYKSKIIKAYFEEMNPEYSISFIEEEKPLGTAGSLELLKNKLNKPFFVSNCDIIVNANYESLCSFHVDGGYDLTLVASTKEYIIPYGTCELNETGHLSHINEKPQYDFLINTGLYILNPNILNLIPKNKFFHITHLIELAKKKGKKIGVYPIDEDAWVDIGQWAEYKKALKSL